jgi:hypothetical protein
MADLSALVHLHFTKSSYHLLLALSDDISLIRSDSTDYLLTTDHTLHFTVTETSRLATSSTSRAQALSLGDG